MNTAVINFSVVYYFLGLWYFCFVNQSPPLPLHAHNFIIVVIETMLH